MDSLALADATMSRLSTATGVSVFLADVPATPVGGYAVVWPDAGRETVGRLDGSVSRESAGFALVCAGWTPEQALNSLRITSGLLRNWQPVEGRFLRLSEGNTLTRDDDDPSDVRWFVTRFYTLTTPA